MPPKGQDLVESLMNATYFDSVGKSAHGLSDDESMHLWHRMLVMADLRYGAEQRARTHAGIAEGMAALGTQICGLFCKAELVYCLHGVRVQGRG